MSPEPTPIRGRTPAAPTVAASIESGEALWKRLHWTVLRPLAAHFGGDERSLLRGPGIELAEVREYQPGDDVRRIDWNVSARMDSTHVRETQAERGLDVWLLLDTSPSLNWGTALGLKRDRAAEFASIAGRLLGSHGNRIGAILFDDQPRGVVPPASGRVHQVRLLARLAAAPAVAGGPTDLTRALRYADQVIRRSSVIIIVSDFLTPDGWQPVLRRLAVRHEVVAVRLDDPREASLPDVGLLTLEDPETGQQLLVDTSNARLRDQYQAAAVAQSALLRSQLAGAGVDLVVLGTEADVASRLIHFLGTRRRRRSQRAHLTPLATSATGGTP